MSSPPNPVLLLADLERATTADAASRVQISKAYREAFVNAPFWRMATHWHFTGPKWATNVLDALQDQALQDAIMGVAKGRGMV